MGTADISGPITLRCCPSHARVVRRIPGLSPRDAGATTPPWPRPQKLVCLPPAPTVSGEQNLAPPPPPESLGQSFIRTCSFFLLGGLSVALYSYKGLRPQKGQFLEAFQNSNDRTHNSRCPCGERHIIMARHVGET